MKVTEHAIDQAIRARQPAYRRIAEGLRNEILSGKFRQGTQLPTSRELAATWRASYFTIHTALMILTKEGWIEVRHGTGTYVADLRTRFICAGIYHDVDVCQDTQTAFRRSLHFALLQQFSLLGKETQVFIDSRPTDQQTEVFPPLAQAIQNRRIQCLVAPNTNPIDSRALSELTLPTAFFANRTLPNRIEFDYEGMLLGSVHRLKEQGCRSIGMINCAPENNYDSLYRVFSKIVQREELATRNEWIRRSSSDVGDLGYFGYSEFRKLWSLPEKPDGLIVWSDDVARGVILAILEKGVRVPAQMHCVFHRNAGVPMLCPLPVTWAISDENDAARGLIRVIEDQFEGKKLAPVLVPFRFEKDEAAKWT